MCFLLLLFVVLFLFFKSGFKYLLHGALVKFIPSRCYINLEKKIGLNPLNICQGFNAVDNITSAIEPGTTIIHYYQIPMPMDSKRTSLEIGLNDLISYFL